MWKIPDMMTQRISYFLESMWKIIVVKNSLGNSTFKVSHLSILSQKYSYSFSLGVQI